jgi:hypothetical protein
MYNITPLNPNDGSALDFIDDDLVTRIKMSDNCFLADIFLLKRLSTIEFSIQNRRLATIQLLEFLTFLDVDLHQNCEDTLIEIPFVTFESYFPRNRVHEYKQILKKLKIITAVPYADGSFYKFDVSGSLEGLGKCMRFRVHKGYLQPKHLGLVVFDPPRTRKYTPILVNGISDLNCKYIKTIKSLRIDVPAAIKAEFDYFRSDHQNIFRFKSRVSIVLLTERDRFIRKGKNVNRIYYTFSNVSRVSREFFNIEFNNVDVKNCQPLLLVSYLCKNRLSFDENYKEDCELSIFYSRFVGINGLDKKAVKVRLYKSIFFGFNTRSRFNKKFKEVYPETWRSLAELKQQKVSLAAELQNLERSLFNYIVPTISEYYYTLYDAIYFTSYEDTDDIVSKIEEFFMNLNVNVMLRINDKEAEVS